jgi:hypothetical protein
MPRNTKNSRVRSQRNDFEFFVIQVKHIVNNFNYGALSMPLQTGAKGLEAFAALGKPSAKMPSFSMFLR